MVKQQAIILRRLCCARGPLLHARFFKQLEPYITKDIFNSKKDFKIYIIKALEIYDKTIQEIAQNVKKRENKALFRDAGFQDIADDVFK